VCQSGWSVQGIEQSSQHDISQVFVSQYVTDYIESRFSVSMTGKLNGSLDAESQHRQTASDADFACGNMWPAGNGRRGKSGPDGSKC
jgi:hypothetical protein